MLLLLACAPTMIERVEDSESSGSTDTATTTWETVVTEDTDTEGIAGIGGIPDVEVEPLFSLEMVHRIDFTLSDDAIDSLYDDPYTYVEAGLTIDDQAMYPVAIRIKGRLGSFRELSGKPAFKVDLNRYFDQTLNGREQMNLNNMVQDNSMLHERIGYGVFRAAGIAAPQVGYVWVTINGDDYGLYTNTEAYDDVWLGLNYDDPSGNLYDGDYHLYDSGSYTFIDFDGSTEYLFALDEGQNVDLTDIYGITDALQSAGSDPYGALDTVIDMKHFLGMWAGEAWLGHYDGYAYNDNNYRIYFDPSDGRARFHPWDPDWAFYSATPVTSPDGELARACMASQPCRAEFVESVDAIQAAVDGSDLLEQLETAAALIAPYVEDDPRREYSASAIFSGQDELRAWMNNRESMLENAGL